MRNTISIWQIVTLSLNNCRKQRKTFRFLWLDETCSQLQPDKQLHGLQKLLVKGWDPGTSAQELGDGLHRHWHDLLHRVSSPTVPRSYCAILKHAEELVWEAASCSYTSLLLFLFLIFLYGILNVSAVLFRNHCATYLVWLPSRRKVLRFHMRSQCVCYMSYVSHKVQSWVGITR